ncbi:MAG: GTPase HflX [Spirochaetales bacterium]|nr:GTPase HflX [Spirochaetales bacterium]
MSRSPVSFQYKRSTRPRALLVSITERSLSTDGAERSMSELNALVRAVNIQPVDSMQAPISRPHPRYLVGSGKAQEITERAKELEVDQVIFDDELTPSRQRNWERLTGLRISDRTEIIIEIFRLRAGSREADLQVELARLEYQLPRLHRAWTHLSRQRGGARGTRGEGEQQLEADRRIYLQRIASVRRELETVKTSRSVMRKRRSELPMPTAALVGYTNAGKSTLLNRLTGAEAFEADRLFATLETTTRELALPGGMRVLLTDTVGFIDKLPHNLVEAFKATLEETRTADILLVVVDVSDPNAANHLATTHSVLEEIGINDSKIITVLNKADQLGDRQPDIGLLDLPERESVLVSAKDGEGIQQLLDMIRGAFSGGREPVELKIPYDRYDLTALVHRTGTVLNEEYRDDHILLSARLPESTSGRLKEFTKRQPNE